MKLFNGHVLARTFAAFALCASTLCSAATPGWTPTLTKAHALANAVGTDAGPLPAIQRVPVVVTLKLRDRSSLNAITDQVGTGQAGAVLSAQDFLDRHAPTLAQATQVADYLRANGFQNVVISNNRLLVTADGTPASVHAAFQVDLHRFTVNGRQAFANVTDANVPAALSDTVLAVVGLQTVHTAHTFSKRVASLAATPLATPQATPQAIVGIAPALFPSLYGASGMPAASTATLGIITQGSMTQTLADLKQAAAAAGYPAPPVSVINVGTPTSDTSNIDEWNLDTQSSLAAAGGTLKAMLLYTSPTLYDSDLIQAYNQAMSDNLAKVVNVSLGECEVSADLSGMRDASDQIFQAAVAQGQTFSVSTGDSGAYECGGSTVAQAYPAVSPYVMALGGTTLSNSGGTWLGETAWSCTGPQTCPQDAAGGTGGGASSTEAAPAWQTAAGTPGAPGSRGVPDIAFDAAPKSGAVILVNGGPVQIGGTSLAAPLFTGFYARIQSAHGNSLGFPAAALYAGAATHPSWFHDVVSGSNGGYAAASGWDYTTGFGSLQVQNFSSALGAAPAPTTWTTIATENQAFTVNGTQTVRYGNDNSWISRSVTGAGTCSNAFFGSDPLYGKVKVCQLAVLTAGSYTRIATEGQSFTVNGTQTVRFGSGSAWLTRSVTGTGQCTRLFFGGDPALGVLKECDLLN